MSSSSSSGKASGHEDNDNNKDYKIHLKDIQTIKTPTCLELLKIVKNLLGRIESLEEENVKLTQLVNEHKKQESSVVQVEQKWSDI